MSATCERLRSYRTIHAFGVLPLISHLGLELCCLGVGMVLDVESLTASEPQESQSRLVVSV